MELSAFQILRKQDAGEEFGTAEVIVSESGNYTEPPTEGAAAPFTGFYFVYTYFFNWINNT